MSRARGVAGQILKYEPLPETGPVRQVIGRFQRPGHPFCPPWQGDFLYALARAGDCRCALEIGFATGSTALYMLAGMKGASAKLTSIDRRPSDHDCLGSLLVQAAGFRERHELIEDDSARALPQLRDAGDRFDLAFMDGWKTFDHLAVDLYYVSRMLCVGGFLVFDDSRMASVKKAIGLLRSHYAYGEVHYAQYGETARLRVRHILTTRSFSRPYRAFRKLQDESELAVARDWDYWRRF